MKFKAIKNIALGLVMATTLNFFGQNVYATEEPKTSLIFDENNYQEKSIDVNGKTVRYRAYENICYVENPVDKKYQVINFYVPMEYYEGKSINGYTKDTAPIFLPNSVGGYMPGEAKKVEDVFKPIILDTMLKNKGFNSDFAIAWGQRHGGDYDLDELFAWIDTICKQ